jgi:hypothetical protein
LFCSLSRAGTAPMSLYYLLVDADEHSGCFGGIKDTFHGGC